MLTPIDYIYIGEADFNGETGYTVDAVSGDKTDTLYFSADRTEAELYLGVGCLRTLR